MYFRNCPQCNKQIQCKDKYALNRALKRNRPCRSCSVRSRKHTDKAKQKTSEARRKMKKKDTHTFNKNYLSSWSRRVRERDCHCQKCHTAENLEAHHIIPKALMPEHAYDDNNGITLCKPCHIELHKELKK